MRCPQCWSCGVLDSSSVGQKALGNVDCKVTLAAPSGPNRTEQPPLGMIYVFLLHSWGCNRDVHFARRHFTVVTAMWILHKYSSFLRVAHPLGPEPRLKPCEAQAQRHSGVCRKILLLKNRTTLDRSHFGVISTMPLVSGNCKVEWLSFLFEFVFAHVQEHRRKTTKDI